MPLWPIHPKPKKDELLSSWLTRIARAYNVTTDDFCKAALPQDRTHFRDIDRTYDAGIFHALAEGSDVPIERVMETSLAIDEGYVFNHRQYGTTEWVLPTVNIDGKISRGLAYCPLCLKSDVEPYYRKSWRFAFNTVCPVHHTFLRQGCSTCGKPYNFNPISDQQLRGDEMFTACMWCNADIYNAHIEAEDQALIISTLAIQTKLNFDLSRNAFYIPNYGHVYALPYLRVLHALMQSLSNPTSAKWVVQKYEFELPTGTVTPAFDCPYNALLIEQCAMKEIATLICLVNILMTEWPNRFIQYANENNITSYRVFKSCNIPYWVTQTATEFLPTKASRVSDQEVESAKQALRKKLGRIESASELKAFMTDGVARSLSKVSKVTRLDISQSCS